MTKPFTDPNKLTESGTLSDVLSRFCCELETTLANMGAIPGEDYSRLDLLDRALRVWYSLPYRTRNETWWTMERESADQKHRAKYGFTDDSNEVSLQEEEDLSAELVDPPPLKPKRRTKRWSTK